MTKYLAALLASVLGAIQSPSAEDVRDKLDAYLLAYEPRLSTLVADEELFQDDTYRKRTIKSEVAFIGLPGNVGWMGFRRVVSVGGRAVSDTGPVLAQVLNVGTRDDYGQARRLLQESARQNLGAPRTTNLPNLPLELLHPRHRQRFSHRFEMNERIDGHNTVRLVAEEVAKPSIIQNPVGGDYHSIVTMWVEPDTGRLIRAEVRSRDTAVVTGGGFETLVRVSFKADAKLGILVPREMQERFFVHRGRSGRGVAKYSNYREFQTGARIVPQGETRD